VTFSLFRLHNVEISLYKVQIPSQLLNLLTNIVPIVVGEGFETVFFIFIKKAALMCIFFVTKAQRADPKEQRTRNGHTEHTTNIKLCNL